MVHGSAPGLSTWGPPVPAPSQLCSVLRPLAGRPPADDFSEALELQFREDLHGEAPSPQRGGGVRAAQRPVQPPPTLAFVGGWEVQRTGGLPPQEEEGPQDAQAQGFFSPDITSPHPLHAPSPTPPHPGILRVRRDCPHFTDGGLGGEGTILTSLGLEDICLSSCPSPVTHLVRTVRASVSPGAQAQR